MKIERLALGSALLLAVACGGRQDAAPPAPGPAAPAAAAQAVPAPVPSVVAAARPGKRVLFVGLDGADWTQLDPLLAAGKLPRLARLVAEGRSGVLTSLHPPLSPLVWTTMMTGVSPIEHGILDFARFHPETGAKEPVSSDERLVPAIWNQASWAGRTSAVFGLWATYPAEPIRGLMVSDRLFTFLFKESQAPPGVVFPAEREAWARGVVAEAETAIGFVALRAYLPWLDEAGYEAALQVAEPYGHPVAALRRILVETEIYRRLALTSLDAGESELTIVYVQGTDTIGHVFAPFAPPRQPSVSPEDFARYSGVPERYFQAVDALLGELAERARAQDAVLMLASDHGFRWHEDRPTELSSFAGATAARWHRSEGVYLLHGPGITPAVGRGVGTVAQVAPTLAALLGLAPAAGVAAAPLPGAPAASPSFDYRPLYRPATRAGSTAGAGGDEELAKLQALGYIGGNDAEKARRGAAGGFETRTAGAYNNLGLLLQAEKRPDEAIAAFDEAIARDPDLASALWNLSDLLFARGNDPDRADRLLLRAAAAGLPQGVQFVVGRAIGYQRSGDAGRSLRLIESAVAAVPREPELHLFRGRYRIEAGDCAGALADFEEAGRLAPENSAAFASAGLALLCLEEPARAAAAFRRSLEIEPEQPRLLETLRKLSGQPPGPRR